MSARIYREDSIQVERYSWSQSPALSSPASSIPIPPAASASLTSTKAATDELSAKLRATEAELGRIRAEMDAQVRQAEKRGFEEGQRKAHTESSAAIDAMQRELAATAARMASVYRETVAQAERDLLRLSIAVAEKILNRQLQADQDALRGVVIAALDRLGSKPASRIRLNPEDRPAVERHLRDLLPQGKLVTEADSSLPRGSLHVETEYGVLDASFSSQLREIELGLADRLQRSNQ